jgi:sulfatase modifying factor 1
MQCTGKITRTLILTLLALACFTADLFSQTLPLRVLPKPARALLENFVLIPGGVFTKNVYNGFDSLQFQLPATASVDSFYMSRFEITVEEYVRFYEETGDPQNKYDPAVWTKDFPYSYNEPMTRNYYTVPPFRQYPAVGVNWAQAMRYCQWKAEQVNALLVNSGYKVDIGLPGDTEWQYAAVGPGPMEENGKVRDVNIFPWDGGFLAPHPSGQGLQLPCNSGPIRTPQQFDLTGHPSDGGLYTVAVNSYEPNKFGLYQMAGNVAEWTRDNYSVDTDRLFAAQLKFQDKPEVLKRYTPGFPPGTYDDYKIVKGGSWVDEPFYMQVGVLKIQHPERASSTVGFRPVLRIYRE